MSLEQFMNDAISPWMREDGPENDIVLSTRIRLARNFRDEVFPTFAEDDTLEKVASYMKENYEHASFQAYEDLSYIDIDRLTPIEKRVLVEKHLISPLLTKSKESAVLISENEQVSIMINEEDHLRIQVYFPGLSLRKALEESFKLDDWLEEKITYAFDEKH